ncbi:hypothetical protein QJS66_01405 [Kocuria rhizophila]|nr:hypothetical protein QJS66_01405 [Kocuria rhizophila]
MDADLPLLHERLSAARPRVELVARPREEVAREYRRMAAAPGEDAWLVSEHGEPLALLSRPTTPPAARSPRSGPCATGTPVGTSSSPPPPAPSPAPRAP